MLLHIEIRPPSGVVPPPPALTPAFAKVSDRQFDPVVSSDPRDSFELPGFIPGPYEAARTERRECGIASVAFKRHEVEPIFPVEFKRRFVKPCADAWAQAGEHGKESSCYTECGAVMYQCHDEAFDAKYDAYQAPAVEAASSVAFKRQVVMPCAYVWPRPATRVARAVATLSARLILLGAVPEGHGQPRRRGAPLRRRDLEASERTLGAEHPDTLASVNNLALCRKGMGNLDAAEPLYRR